MHQKYHATWFESSESIWPRSFCMYICIYIAYLLVLARIFHDRNFDVGPTLQALTAS